MFFPKKWWQVNRLWIAAGIISLVANIHLALYRESEVIYLFLFLIIFVGNRLNGDEALWIPIILLSEMELLYLLYDQRDNLFHFTAFVLLCAVIFLSLRTRKQRQEKYELNKRHLEELQDAYDQLQEAAVTSMEFAVIEERTRIARDMHDAVGHSLTTLIVQLQNLRYKQSKVSGYQTDSLDELLHVARQGLADIRTSVHALADDRSRLGIASLKALLSRMETMTSMNYTFRNDVDEAKLDIKTCGTFFRILQEAITNIVRHAQATSVDVTITEEFGKAVMTISDDGFLTPASGQISEGFGLQVMRMRLEEKGGRLIYFILEPHGFELRAEIPIADDLIVNQLGGSENDAATKD